MALSSAFDALALTDASPPPPPPPPAASCLSPPALEQTPPPTPPARGGGGGGASVTTAVNAPAARDRTWTTEEIENRIVRNPAHFAWWTPLDPDEPLFPSDAERATCDGNDAALATLEARYETRRRAVLRRHGAIIDAVIAPGDAWRAATATPVDAVAREKRLQALIWHTELIGYDALIAPGLADADAAILERALFTDTTLTGLGGAELGKTVTGGTVTSLRRHLSQSIYLTVQAADRAGVFAYLARTKNGSAAIAFIANPAEPGGGGDGASRGSGSAGRRTTTLRTRLQERAVAALVALYVHHLRVPITVSVPTAVSTAPRLRGFIGAIGGVLVATTPADGLVHYAFAYDARTERNDPFADAALGSAAVHLLVCRVADMRTGRSIPVRPAELRAAFAAAGGDAARHLALECVVARDACAHPAGALTGPLYAMPRAVVRVGESDLDAARRAFEGVPGARDSLAARPAAQPDASAPPQFQRTGAGDWHRDEPSLFMCTHHQVYEVSVIPEAADVIFAALSGGAPGDATCGSATPAMPTDYRVVHLPFGDVAGAPPPKRAPATTSVTDALGNERRLSDLTNAIIGDAFVAVADVLHRIATAPPPTTAVAAPSEPAANPSDAPPPPPARTVAATAREAPMDPEHKTVRDSDAPAAPQPDQRLFTGDVWMEVTRDTAHELHLRVHLMAPGAADAPSPGAERVDAAFLSPETGLPFVAEWVTAYKKRTDAAWRTGGRHGIPVGIELRIDASAPGAEALARNAEAVKRHLFTQRNESQ